LEPPVFTPNHSGLSLEKIQQLASSPYSKYKKQSYLASIRDLLDHVEGLKDHIEEVACEWVDTADSMIADLLEVPWEAFWMNSGFLAVRYIFVIHSANELLRINRVVMECMREKKNQAGLLPKSYVQQKNSRNQFNHQGKYANGYARFV
jgi:hypothetical protein